MVTIYKSIARVMRAVVRALKIYQSVQKFYRACRTCLIPALKQIDGSTVYEYEASWIMR